MIKEEEADLEFGCLFCCCISLSESSDFVESPFECFKICIAFRACVFCHFIHNDCVKPGQLSWIVSQRIQLGSNTEEFYQIPTVSKLSGDKLRPVVHAWICIQYAINAAIASAAFCNTSNHLLRCLERYNLKRNRR